ncbi:MAG: hypothetical protein HFJ84_10940 [Clostridiales bacterium]|jgi:hypothetical protein|nr:hypothetical protein [Clostridiales bacterium]
MLKKRTKKIIAVTCVVCVLSSMCVLSASAKTLYYRFNMSTNRPANNTSLVLKENSGAAVIQTNFFQTTGTSGFLYYSVQDETYTQVSDSTYCGSIGTAKSIYWKDKGKVGTNYRLRGDFYASGVGEIEAKGDFTP